MIADAKNADLYAEWLDQITDADAKDAFRYLVGLAATSRAFTCHPQHKGEVRDFRFFDGDDQLFALIPNRSWLLFYVRLPAIRSGRYSLTVLQAAFESAQANSSGEWTVRLRSIADVQRLWRVLDLS